MYKRALITALIYESRSCEDSRSNDSEAACFAQVYLGNTSFFNKVYVALRSSFVLNLLPVDYFGGTYPIQTR